METETNNSQKLLRKNASVASAQTAAWSLFLSLHSEWQRRWFDCVIT